MMGQSLLIHCRRVYDPLLMDGAYRVLVDRVWPRGIRKQTLMLDEWCRELAPSPDLRTWFGHDPKRWRAFCERYYKELEASHNDIRQLLDRCSSRPLLLLYGARDTEHNNAKALQAFIEASFF